MSTVGGKAYLCVQGSRDEGLHSGLLDPAPISVSPLKPQTCSCHRAGTVALQEHAHISQFLREQWSQLMTRTV